ncbi:MAG: DNA repair protein RadC [Methanophagales archaeon]|nr:DNA repair protein RadC [Methanophagales archaeon]
MNKEIQYGLKVMDIPPEDRPREKLKKYGPEVLSNQELLAIIFGRGTKKEGVLEISKRIISEYGEQPILSQTRVEKVINRFNLGEVHAGQLISCLELGRRFFGDSKDDVYIKTPKDAYEYLSDMRKIKKEFFRGLYLDVNNRLIHDELISVGTLTTNLVHPREVFYPAISKRAVAIILAHNHPSGDPEPTEDDIEMTKQMVNVSKIMEIELLDHVIIGNNKFVSLKQRGVNFDIL